MLSLVSALVTQWYSSRLGAVLLINDSRYSDIIWCQLDSLIVFCQSAVIRLSYLSIFNNLRASPRLLYRRLSCARIALALSGSIKPTGYQPSLIYSRCQTYQIATAICAREEREWYDFCLYSICRVTACRVIIPGVLTTHPGSAGTHYKIHALVVML